MYHYCTPVKETFSNLTVPHSHSATHPHKQEISPGSYCFKIPFDTSYFRPKLRLPYRIPTVAHVSGTAAVRHKKNYLEPKKLNDGKNELDILSFCKNASEISSKLVCIFTNLFKKRPSQIKSDFTESNY